MGQQLVGLADTLDLTPEAVANSAETSASVRLCPFGIVSYSQEIAQHPSRSPITMPRLP